MIKGLDLSPYFLAVAAQKEEQLSRQNPIHWVHANGEATGLPSNSFDVVSLAYVVISIRPNFYIADVLLIPVLVTLKC
jgi:ubiquinone/menaquinone biosynthesis C-methylase UbiE